MRTAHLAHPPAQITRLKPGTRRLLRIAGGILLAAGLVCFSAPFFAVPLAMSGDFSLVPYAFLFAFPGLIMIAAGSTMLGYGFMKAQSEIVAAETELATEHAAAAGARGFGRGLRESGALEGLRGGDVAKVRCRSCGYLESEDARFCSRCAKAV